MNLAQFPRQRYTLSYTPIEKLAHFSEDSWWAYYLYEKR